MKKRRPSSGGGHGTRSAARPARGRGGSGRGLLALQRAVGNRATGELLGKGVGVEERLSLLGAKLPPAHLWSGPGGSLGATVYFGQNDFLLVPTQLRVVEELAEQTKSVFEPTILVDGHASTEGTDEDNLRLSKMRRLAVLSILTSKLPKILKAVYSGEAHGETDPAVAETAKDRDELERQRALNRRVEIMVLPAHRAGPPAETTATEPKKSFEHRIMEWPPRKPGESWEAWDKRRREEELSRRLTEPPPAFERPKFSLEKAAKEKLSDGLGKLGVPPKWRKRIVDAAVAGGLSGANKIVDATGLGGETKDAVKALLEATFKQEF